MTSVSTPLQLLSVSAFGALISLRHYMREHGVEPLAAITALKSINPHFASSDSAKGLTLHGRLPKEFTFDDIPKDMRSSIALLIEHERPWWRRVFTAGRGHVANALTEDELQTFSHAGLFDTPPTEEIRAWWYRIESEVRAEQNLKNTESGGNAEIWSLEYEMKRVAVFDLDLKPELVGFENHSLGYDIKSYDPGKLAPVSRLIEVKSSKSIPPQINVTRGEWNKALENPSVYFFYIWWGEPIQHAIVTVKEVAKHMPTDQGDGQWKEVKITFDPNDLMAFPAPILSD